MIKFNFVTCSGTNEYTNIRELVELLKEFPAAEIAVQVSEKQSPAGGARIEWVHELAAYLRDQHLVINTALHINCKWVEEMCRGIVVPELQNLIELRDIYGLPLFRRLQLNFKLGRDDVRPDCDDTLLQLQHRIDRRFILSCNESNERLIRQLYLIGLHFDVLYDSSFGTGIAPDERKAPMFANILQGYAGGITPDNVCTELGKIAQAVENSASLGNIYIDAQKGLEDEQTHLSLDKCHQYLENATRWYRIYRYNSEF
jgi:hypothetical protein